jgi:hypothetical protein
VQPSPREAHEVKKMRRLHARRKAVSSIIGGLIILTVILTALTAMVLVAQQYDTYQSILDVMSQKDIDRLSENIIAVYPGISGPQLVSGCGGSCNQYNMSLTNLGGIGTQIVRMYLNSTPPGDCYNLCVFSNSSALSPFHFLSSSSFINPAEAGHVLVFWLPSTINLPTDSPQANTIGLATSRGRTFSFQWPFPPAGNYVPTDLHLDMGPIRITYDPNLITFTTNSSQHQSPGPSGCANTQPSSNPCMPGGWTTTFPTTLFDRGFVFYLRMSNIGTSPVELLDRSYVYARGWTNGTNPTPDNPVLFYIIQPMSQNCWSSYFRSSYFDNSSNTWPLTGACPTPVEFQAYNGTGNPPYPTTCTSNNPCYLLPQGSTLGVPGTPVYVLFSASARHQSTPASPTLNGSHIYVLYLELYYQYPAHTGYEYTLTIPLFTIRT